MIDSRFETTIDDDQGTAHKYRVSRYPSGQGFNLLPVIIQIASGPLGDLIDAMDGDMDGKVNGEKLGSALSGLAAAIIQRGSAEFLKELLEYATRGDSPEQKVPANFDKIYQGNYGELFAAVAWVMEINYAPFLKRYLGGDLGGLKDRIMQKLSA